MSEEQGDASDRQAAFISALALWHVARRVSGAVTLSGAGSTRLSRLTVAAV